MCAISLFQPWLMSVDIRDNLISQITEYGGKIEIDINLLDPDCSIYDEENLFLITTEGRELVLLGVLFRQSDLRRLVEYINSYESITETQ